jgi:predicted Abi (CAAX) family protease
MASTGRNFNFSDVTYAWWVYVKEVTKGTFTGDALKPRALKKNLVDRLLTKYDFTEDAQRQLQEYGPTATFPRLKNIGINKVLMAPYEITDHFMQALPLLACLKH